VHGWDWAREQFTQSPRHRLRTMASPLVCVGHGLRFCRRQYSVRLMHAPRPHISIGRFYCGLHQSRSLLGAPRSAIAGRSVVVRELQPAALSIMFLALAGQASGQN